MMTSTTGRLTSLAVLLLLLSGCSSVPPMPVPAHNPPLALVRTDIKAHLHQQVLWGGVILHTQVKPTVSLVMILAKPLYSSGEPQVTDKSYGRFIAQFNGFRDPAVFAAGRRLTVAGSIQGSQTHNIGDYPYTYPVVAVGQYRLWAAPVRTYYNDDDYWWYEPWHPWYPWYPRYYPYYHPLPRTAPPPTKR